MERRLRTEFEYEKLNKILRAIVIYASGYIWYKYRKPLHITNVYRDPTTDPKGMHSSWRAVDGDNDELTQDQKKEIEAHINELFKYDPFRPNLKACLHHTADQSQYSGIKTGGDHFHFQVHPNTIFMNG